MPPVISILIPCFNYAHFLPQCLQSLQAQTFTAWEAIVVDDASTKGDVMAAVSSVNDQRVSLIRNAENRGLGATLNIAFASSLSPWVVILSADDLFAPTLLEEAWKIISQEPAVDVVFPDLQLFGNKSERWSYQVYDAEKMTRGQWLPGAGAVMRRAVWERAGGNYEGPELRLGNIDWDFWLGAMAQGIVVRHIPEPLYLYRSHGPSTSTTRNLNCHVTHDCIYERHREIFERYGTGKRFLADGYLHTATASYAAGQRLRAALTAAKAWYILEAVPDPPAPLSSGLPSEQLPVVKAQLEKTIASAPDKASTHTLANVVTHVNLGIVSREAGDLYAALEQLFIAAGMLVQLAPGSGDLIRIIGLIGCCYRMKGELTFAQDALRLALRLAPSDFESCCALVDLLLEQGETTEAAGVIRRALDAAPPSHQLLILLGRITLAALSGLEAGNFGELQWVIQPASQPLLANDAEFQEVLYASKLGRKIWWNYRARDLYLTYGHQQGGYDTLEPTVRELAPRRLLEIGCGNGRNFQLYVKLAVPEVVGQDINESALELAAQRGYSHIRLHPEPITELPYPDGYFDLVVSNRVLQHIPFQEVTEAIRAVCRLGNAVYLNEITSEELAAKEIADAGYHSFCHDYEILFRNNGFSVNSKQVADGQIRYLFRRG